MVYIISFLHPLCASLCYLWLIYATLNLALIVNVRGEMRGLSLLCLCLSRTWSRRIRWFWISTAVLKWASLSSDENLFIIVTVFPICLFSLWVESETRILVFTPRVKHKIFYRKAEMCPLCHYCWQQLLWAVFLSIPYYWHLVNKCGGFVVIKPGLGLDLEKDAVKTTVYLE